MSTRRYSSEYKALQPFVVEDIRRIVASGVSPLTGGGTGGGIAAHILSDTSIHTGELAITQAPWAATKVELNAHAQNPDAHHARQHSIISSADHTVAGSAWQVVGLTGENTLGLLTPLADVTGATKEALLKSDASGHFTAVRLVASDRLRAPLIDTATGNLTIQPAVDLLLAPGSNLVKVRDGKAVQTESFVSGFAGNGFRIDQGISRAGKTHMETDDLTVRGRLSVYELLIRQIRATNGSVFVTSTAKVKTVSSLGGDNYRLTTDSETAHGFLVDDLIRAQRFTGSGVYQCDLRVVAVGDLYTFDVDVVTGSIAPQAGMEFVRLGNATDPDRRGSIYLTADDTNAPFIDVVDGISSHSQWNTAGKVKVRMGKLTGISGQANAYGIFSGNPAATWQSMETVNGFRIGVAGITRFGVDTSGNLRLYDSSGAAVIALDSDGSSYFAGVMTIGASGEIRQGTGALGSNYTGLRIWRDGSVGRIAGYANNVQQWYATTGGELRAGAGLAAMAADGFGLARYATEAGTPIGGTEARAALAWWDNIDSRTGAPIARAYAGRSSAGTGAVPALALEVDPANATAGKRPALWLTGSHPAYNNAPSLWLTNIYTVVGLPGIYPQRNPTTLAESVYFSGSLYLQAHLLRDPAISAIDIGTAGNPLRTVYATNIIATSISGAAMSGQEWEYAGSILIDANSDSHTTVTIANGGAGRADLDVDRNITLGGTVDGVDLAAFYTAYGSHISNANAHHAQAHALDGSDHTGTLAWAKVSKAGSALADLATRPHNSLTGIGANDHHNQAHAITGSDHTVSGSTLQIVGLTGTDTLGLLTPSSNPGSASAILRTASGALTLAQLTISAAGALYLDGVLDFGTNTLYEDATYLQVAGSKALRFGQNLGNANWTIYNAGGASFGGNVDVLAGGDLTVIGSGSYAGSQVLFADSSGGNVGIMCAPDPQFALDVLGPARASYFVGPHAIQLKDVLLLAHFDGGGPVETNFTGEPNGHMGQVGRAVGGVVFRPGKFYKAAQVAQPTTNLVINPSFEVDLSGWATVTTGSGGEFVRTAAFAYVGVVAARVTATTGGVYTIRTTATVTVANGASVSMQCMMRRAAATAATLVIRDVTNGATRATATPTKSAEWELLTATWTNTTGGAANVELRITNSAGDGSARIWVDACQIELNAFATPYCDGGLGGYNAAGLWDGSGHAWTGAAHASTSTRGAAALSYATAANLDSRRGSIMAWVNVAALTGADQEVLRATGTTAGNILLRLDSLGRPQARWGTAGITSATAITPGTWVHLAATYDGATVRVYVNGIQAASGSANDFDGLPDTMYAGRSSSAANWLNGWIDDLCILSYAADATLIRTVYESNAPVFAETSRFSFRATPKGLVWADDEGLWMRDVGGNPVLGVYGGEAASKSWGGFTLAVGDLVIGRNALDAAAIMWDQSTGKFGFYGGGNGTPQVEIGTDGQVLAGAGAVRLGSTGMGAYNDSNMLVVTVNNSGINLLQDGGPRGTVWGSYASRIKMPMGQLFGAAAETYTDGVELSRYMEPVVLRAIWDGAATDAAAWLELSAAKYDLSSKARIIVADGYWLPEGYSNPSIYNTTNVIDLQASLVLLSAAKVRFQGSTTSTAAVGTYAGKIKVNIDGTDRWIPYYAS